MTEARAGEAQQQHPDPFVWFPSWLLGISNPYEKAVLLALLSHQDGSISPSHRALAEEAGCSRRTVIECLKAMRQKGWLSWQERFDAEGRITNVYTLHLDNHE